MAETMDAVEHSAAARYTGLAKLISCYRYISFSLPRTTTTLGVVLLLGIAAIRLLWLAGGFIVPDYPAYLAAYFALVAALAFVAAAAMVVPRAGPAMLGWALGSLVSTATIAVYVATRALGLPGLPQLVGRWDFALGTFAMALAGLFLAVHFTVLTGMNVAYPRRRRWHD
jgi:hypothetical protein